MLKDTFVAPARRDARTDPMSDDTPEDDVSMSDDKPEDATAPETSAAPQAAAPETAAPPAAPPPTPSVPVWPIVNLDPNVVVPPPTDRPAQPWEAPEFQRECAAKRQGVLAMYYGRDPGVGGMFGTDEEMWRQRFDPVGEARLKTLRVLAQNGHGPDDPMVRETVQYFCVEKQKELERDPVFQKSRMLAWLGDGTVEKMSVKELQNTCKKYGLGKSGSKAQMADRLREWAEAPPEESEEEE